MIPCPHCLQPAYLSEASGYTIHPTDFRCVNERCPNSTSYISITAYDNEIQFIKKRINDGYSYPKKVIQFAENFYKDEKNEQRIC